METLEDRNCPAPLVDFAIQGVNGTNVLLGGHVYGAIGQPTVQFSGVASGTTQVDGEGNFFIELEASALGAISAVAIDGEESSPPASVEVTSEVPSLAYLVASQAAGNVWTFTGAIYDEDPAGAVVTFSGMSELEGQTVAVDAYGGFTFSVTLPAGVNGTVTASAKDIWQQTGSGYVEVVAAAAPTLTYGITSVMGKSVTLQGYVTGDYAAGATVTFGGVVSAMTVADEGGYFSITVEASSLGDIVGYAVDCMNLQSDDFTYAVISQPPTVIDFSVAMESYGTWLFSGTIADELDGDVTVVFSGLSWVANKTAEADAAGYFYLCILEAPAEYGQVTITVTDQWGQTCTSYCEVIDPGF